MQWLKKIFTGGDAEIKQLEKIAAQVDAFEDAHRSLSDSDFPAATARLRERISSEPIDAILPEAYSLVREAMDRAIGKRHFHVQILGGIALHQGRIAEMKTGEGKTFVALLPAYLNALTGEGVHIVTVNDYLAKFQGEWMAHVLRFLGMTTGIITQDRTNEERRKAYAADVTYGTNNQMGFDYLRDNMVLYKEQMVQRGHAYAIVDEADSILIDEARTPLIISGQSDKATDMYAKANSFVIRLKDEQDFTRDEKQHAINLTETGAEKAERHFGVDNLADPANSELNHHINAALRANFLMSRDKDYVVQNGQVVIVDEFTGRLMVGRRYSNGIHQAIEAKEKVKIENENQTLASITFQNYFRMYKKLSGMTGTAKTEEAEFKGIYNLDVVSIPTNKPMVRTDLNDVIYTTEKAKLERVVSEIETRHAKGQPVLVGTISVEKSEQLSKMLDNIGLKHEVLNAKQHQREAEIVAQAGKYGAITIATNMAGRGTDILLGGNPEFMARRDMRQEGFTDGIIEEALGHEANVSDEVVAARARLNELTRKYEKETTREHDKVTSVGGLHIIGTERHESRRIDNQLRGRAGRQGDVGSSQFFISPEDDMLRVFGSNKMSQILTNMKSAENVPIEMGILTKQIENSQKHVEGRNFDARKHVLQYDDVMNQQREIIYGQRRKVLEGDDIKEQIITMIRAIVTDAVERFVAGDDPEAWDVKGLSDYLRRLTLTIPPDEIENLALSSKESLTINLQAQAIVAYQNKEKEFEEKNISIREIERTVLLQVVDRNWMDHIDAMDHLRQGVGLRAIGHKDPIVEFRLESFDMFDEMVRTIREQTVFFLFAAKPELKERKSVVKNAAPKQEDAPMKPRVAPAKVGRNDPCPCGSGKKYKQCHGKEG